MNRTVNRRTSAATLAVLALALGGCQLLGIGGPRAARAPVQADPAILANFGSDQLSEGRKALTEGRTVDAINAFMLAKSFQEHTPAAYNGLAVAYSRLGREDLAERFFLTAAALDPDDPRYRSNLAIFYAHHGVPRDNGEALANASVEQAFDQSANAGETGRSELVVSPERTMRAGVTVRTPVSRMHRVSAAEVRVGGSPANPSINPSGRRAVIEVGGRAGKPASPARVAAASSSEFDAAMREYPIRYPLDD